MVPICFKRELSCLLAVLLTSFLLPVISHALPGDLNGSGRVDGFDLILFGRANGAAVSDSNWNPDADLNRDAVINQDDLTILSAHFGKNGLGFGLWVGGQDGSERLFKLSETGNLYQKLDAYSAPVSIAADMATNSVWVADSSLDQVVSISSLDGSKQLAVSGMDPVSISTDARDGSLWVADYDNNQVVKLLPLITDGYEVGTDTGSHVTVKGFNKPRSVSVNPETGVIWVADTGSNRVVRLSADVPDGYDIQTDTGSHSVKTGFSSPYCVSVNSSDGTVWVADYWSQQVIKLSASGTTEVLRVGGFNLPTVVDVNYIDGSVWVADSGNDQMVRLAADGALIFRVGGFENPSGLGVNPLDGSGWVADNGNNQIVKLSPNGTELMRVSGISRPVAIALVPDEVSQARYPTAVGKSNVDSAAPGESVTFTGTAVDPNGKITLYEWDFDGDGNFDYSSSESGVTTYAYGTAGLYNPVFRVTDDEWLTATDYSQILRIGELQAVATADALNGNAPLNVTFGGEFVDPIDGFVESFQWDFDGDNIFDHFSETTPAASYTYTEPGTYVATLKITDGLYSASDQVTIHVATSSPVVTVSASSSGGTSPLKVDFSATATDPDGSILLYEWDFQDDGVYDWFSISGPDTYFVYAADGTYTARLRVTDDDGLTTTTTVEVDAGESATPLAAVFNIDKNTGRAPFTVNFDASESSVASIVEYEWNFGECSLFYDSMEGDTGQWQAGTAWARVRTTSHSQNTSWTDSPGKDYDDNADNALTTVSLDLSGVSSATLSFWHRYETESYRDYCRVEISTDGGENWNTLTSFSGTQTPWTPVEINISSYLASDVQIRFRLTSNATTTHDGWYVDDVKVCSPDRDWIVTPGSTTSHTYTRSGKFTPTLRVTDMDGNQKTAAAQIQVIPGYFPDATADAAPMTGETPLTVTFTATASDNDGSLAAYDWNFGEEFIWVADQSNDEVVRLCQDGSCEMARTVGFNDPYDVSINPGDGTVWVADYYNHDVVRLSADGQTELVRADGFYYPRSVSVNSTDGSVWVADTSHNQVVKLSPDGRELVRTGGFSYPYCVSVNSTDGSVWVADYSNHQVVQLGSDGRGLKRITGFSNPFSLAVNPGDGTVWVADTGIDKIVRLDSDIRDGYDMGVESESHQAFDGFNEPYSVAINSQDDTVWVADYYNNQVVHLSSDGSELSRTGGFNGPTGVAVNSFTGMVWVADYYNNEVVRLSSNGVELSRQGGFYRPKAIAVADTGVTNHYHSDTSGNTSHVYTRPGIYHAVFTATDNDGNGVNRSMDIVVSGAPEVTAIANISSGPAPLTVFLSAAVTELSGTIIQYEWDFDGDGTYDAVSHTTPSIRHVYSTPGTYNSILRVTSDVGYSNTDAVTVVAGENPPTAMADAAPLRGNLPLVVNFNGSGSDADGTLVKYEWDFENNGTFDYVSDVTGVTTHTFDTAGSYTAILRVTDNSGLTSTDSVDIAAEPAGKPSALIQMATPSKIFAQGNVEFYLHGIDPDGTIVKYEIDYTGNGVFETVQPTAFGDNMESGAGYWSADAPWARVLTDFYSPSHCWTESPSGNYPDNADISLTSATIDLSAANTPKLMFRHRYSFKSGDYGRVEVSGDNGGSWSQKKYYSNKTEAGWILEEVDLAPYAGNPNVKIRFRVTSNDADTADGWYIDDVWLGDPLTYTYGTHGEYDLAVRVTDNDGKTAVTTQRISVFAGESRTNIWVADYYNNRVVKLSDLGDTLAVVTGFNRPMAVEADTVTGEVWVSDTNNNRVVKLSKDVPDNHNVSLVYTPDGSAGNNSGGFSGDTALADAKFGKGAALDGSGDYVMIPSDPALDVQSFTVEAWIKSASVNGRALFMRGDNSGGNELYFGFSNASKIEAIVDNGSSVYFDGAINFADDSWHHLALTYDGVTGDLRCYADGLLYGAPVSKIVTLDFGNSHALIGADFDSFNSYLGNYFSGTIDEVRIWNMVRSPAEISGHKDAVLVGNEPGLSGYWKLDSAGYIHQTVTAEFKSPQGLSVNPLDGTVWVADKSNNQVVKIAKDGTEIKRISGFRSPQAVEVNPADGSVWVADTGNNRIVKLAPDVPGDFTVTADDDYAWIVTGFNGPRGLVLDPSDNGLWVADYYNNKAVKLAADGTRTAQKAGLKNPSSIDMDTSDRSVWVVDSGNNRLVRFLSNGTEISWAQGFNSPTDVAVNPEDATVWVADYSAHQVVKLAPDGAELLRLDGFYYPTSISIDTSARTQHTPPTVTATATPLAGNISLGVTFAGSGTAASGIASYAWDFDGNGVFDYESTTTANTSYFYTEPGVYSPVLRVTDSLGLMAFALPGPVHVGPATVHPTVTPATGNAPLTVNLDGRLSGLASGRYLTNYEWDYEGDGVFDYASSDGPAASFTYLLGGTYNATLRVTDDLGNQTYGSLQIQVDLQSPTVSNNATPASGSLPLVVALNASGRDKDGSVVRYEWDYDGDGTYDWFSASESNTWFSYKTAGTYEAVVRVTDNDGLTATASKTITVGESQQVPVATVSASVTKGTAPLNVTFTGQATDPDGEIDLFEWDFDGDNTFDYSSADTGNTAHTYAVAGTYHALFRVTDADGLIATKDLLINVKEVSDPVARANADPTIGKTPLTVNFNGAGSSDSQGEIVQYDWSFGSDAAWVADYNNDRLQHFSGYQSDEIVGGFNNPYRLCLNPNDQTLWLTDYNNNQVVKLSADGKTELVRASGFNRPHGLSVDPSDGSVWIADYSNYQVVKLDQSGNELLRLDGFKNSTSVAVYNADSSVWVADYGNHQVVRLSPDGINLARIGGFYNPNWVAVDQRDGGVWIADGNNDRVVKLSPDTPDGYTTAVKSVTPAERSSHPAMMFGDTAPGDGKLSNGLMFDGSSDYVLISNGDLPAMTDFTVEAWIKVNSTSSRTIFMRGNDQGGNELYFGIYNASTLEAILDNGSTKRFSGSVNFSDGSWHHVALTYSDTQGVLACFVDGLPYGDPVSVTAEFDFGGSHSLIGADFDSFNASLGDYFYGSIDDVRIWNLSRTQSELAGAKDSELIGSETGLIGYWKFNTAEKTPYHQILAGFDEPVAIAVSPLDGSAWVCDYRHKQMVRVSSDCTREIVRVDGFNRPHEAAVNPSDGSVWVADYNNSQIIVMTDTGRKIKTISNFYNPTSVVIRPLVGNRISLTEDQTITHIYPATGEYIASLTVTDEDGNKDTDTVAIHAGTDIMSMPVVYPTSGTAPLTVRCSANGYSPGGTIEHFDWNFGDGSADWSVTISENTTHLYTQPGIYTITQTVTDNRGLTDTHQVTVTVLPPKDTFAAFASADPAEGNLPLDVKLTGLARNGQGTIARYEWDFENDGTVDYTSTTSGITAHTYTSVGVYTARFKVTGSDGQYAEDLVRIEAKALGAPLANAGASITSGAAALNVSFTGRGSDNGSIVKFEWDFDGNGIYDYSSTLTGDVEHTYTTPGSFNAILRVTDDSGLTDTAMVNINVTAGITALVSPSVFDPTAGETAQIRSVITSSMRVTVFVTDRNGNTIRTLVRDQQRSPGYYSDVWDGKDETGNILASGSYLYLIEYETDAGKFVYDLTNNAQLARYTPSVVYPDSFNPFNAETNFFRYTLDTNSEVTVYISPFTSGAGTRIKTLVLRKPQKAGSYVLTWDGTDDAGDLVPAGNYVIAVMGWRMPENAVIINTHPVISDLVVDPTFMNPDALPYSRANAAAFSYTLSKSADVLVSIYDSLNYNVQNILKKNVASGSDKTIVWDGKNRDGKNVAPGIYRIKLIATDSNGNSSDDVNTLLMIFY